MADLLGSLRSFLAHHAGDPDAARPMVQSITIEGREVRAVTPEGQTRTISVGRLVERLAPRRLDTAGSILPDGVKWLMPSDKGVVLAHQTPPRVYNLRWIAPDSPARFGPGASYRPVRIALPYLVVLATFKRDRRGLLALTNWNECFFRKAPLRSEADPLLYPCLLNCSRMEPGEGRPLAWICTQHLERRDLDAERDQDQRLHKGLGALLRHLIDTGFNYSSEHHESSSWFSETVKARVDPRVASVEAWEQASARDPLFVLEVPWLETGRSLRQAAERILAAPELRPAQVDSANAIARFILAKAQDEGPPA